MVTSWLAAADPTTEWARQSWPDFASLAGREYAVVILPVHACAAADAAAPCDAGETAGSVLLHAAVVRAAAHFTVRVLPPLRFTAAPGKDVLFGLDFDAATDLIREIAAGVGDAGFRKLVFFNTHPDSEPMVTTAAVDIRAESGLNTYVIDACALGVVPGAPAGIDAAAAARLSHLLEEIRVHRAPRPPPAGGPPPAADVPPQFPPFRTRYLPAFPPSRLSTFPEQALAVLPVGAIEQHGPHLPVGVDAILGLALLQAAFSRLPDDLPVWAAPPLSYGKSNEHSGFPGTVAISARSLRHLVLAVARQVRDLGVRRLAVFNTHGGNRHVLVATVREIQSTLGLSAAILRHGYVPDLDPREAAWGLHAGEWETSLMLACAPDCVHLNRAVAEYPPRLDDPGELRPERTAATYGWLTRDLSRSGVIGNPTRATPEKGRAWLDGTGTALAAAIRRLCEA